MKARLLVALVALSALPAAILAGAAGPASAPAAHSHAHPRPYLAMMCTNENIASLCGSSGNSGG